MVSRKVLPIDGAVTFVVVVVFLVPSVLTEFKATFNTRCLNFEKTKPEICDKAWKLFEQAYEGKDPNEVKKEHYEPLFAEIPFTHSCKKTLLYSNTRDLVHKFVGKRQCFTTIWDTMLGKAVEDVNWCGKKNSKGTFTGEKDCESSNPKDSFFEIASIRFAEHACDVVKVLLNGEVSVPYDLNSYLARFEVPKLKHTKGKQLPTDVTKLVVILYVEKKGKQCKDKSLDDLQNILKGKEIDYECMEVPKSELGHCKPE